MEKLFAVLGGPNQNIVINTIVAESKEIAETCTNATCIQFEYGMDVESNKHKWDGSAFVVATEADFKMPKESIK